MALGAYQAEVIEGARGSQLPRSGRTNQAQGVNCSESVRLGMGLLEPDVGRSLYTETGVYVEVVPFGFRTLYGASRTSNMAPCLASSAAATILARSRALLPRTGEPTARPLSSVTR